MLSNAGEIMNRDLIVNGPDGSMENQKDGTIFVYKGATVFNLGIDEDGVIAGRSNGIVRSSLGSTWLCLFSSPFLSLRS